MTVTRRCSVVTIATNAAVVLGNVGTANDVDVLTRALGDEEPLGREHAAWTLARVADRRHASVSHPLTPCRNADTHTDAGR